MPELPEVETTARRLNKLVKGRVIKYFWTDWPKYFRLAGSKRKFRGHVVRKMIKNVRRVGKNVIFDLSDDHILLIHQKLSGHLLVGKWRKAASSKNLREDWRGQRWVPLAPKTSPLWDPENRFIRLIFFLDNGDQLALSDLRRFAKVICGPKEKVLNLPDLKNLGPDPTARSFTFKKFKNLFENKKGKIKTVLMDQTLIAGIGNIYSDEILWRAGIHPLSRVEELDEKELRAIYEATKEILKKALRLQGTSIDDYRKPGGEKGEYAEARYAYQREGEKCKRHDGGTIRRIRIGGRSAHFCPKHQKLVT